MDAEEIPESFTDTDCTPWTIRATSPGYGCEHGTDDCPCLHDATLEFRSYPDDDGGCGLSFLCDDHSVNFYLWLIGEGPKP